MKNLIEEIKNNKLDIEKHNELFASAWNSSIDNCCSVLNQYNIITVPKSIKLSEIVDKLKNNYSYDDVMIFRNSTYTRIVGRIQHHSFSSTETLFDINFNNVLDKPNFNYKWLYTLWIAGTEIVDDLKEKTK